MSERTQQGPRPAAERHRALEGATLGDCRIEAFLGQGGMAAVYRAEQLGLERKVAVKVLSPRLTRDPQQVEQFLREARALAKLEHPHIVRIYSVGHDDGLHYLVTQLVTQGSLRDLLAREERLSPERAIKAARELCLGLGAAHRAGIVHRDVKPDNVLVGNDGDMLLTDFGLARMLDDPTQSVGKIQGTPHYMPPEQVDGRPVDARADLYSLGATLYHLLTGAPPFAAKSVYELLLKHVSAPVVPPHERQPEVPEELSRVVCRLLEKDPDARFADVEEVLAALAGGPQTPAPPRAAPAPAEPPPAPELLLTPELPPLALPPAALPAPRGRGRLALAGLALIGVAAFGWPDLQLALAGEGAAQAQLLERELAQLDGAALAPEDALQALSALEAAHPGAPALAAKRAELEASVAARARPRLDEARTQLDADAPGPALDALSRLPAALPADLAQEAQALAERAEERLARAGFAWVPGGPAPSGEGPSAIVRELPGCYLQRREVTRAEYARAALKHGLYLPWGEGMPPAAEADLPLVGISLRDAARFAHAQGLRLPTAYEWERAARGLDGRRWPWGDAPDPEACNWAGTGGASAAPGSYPRDLGPSGCLDLAGNVAELTLAPDHSPQAPRAWIRGGSFASGDLLTARGAFYLELDPDARDPRVGVRLAADALPEAK